MSLEIVFSKALSTGLVLAFFLCIIGLLRFLYGPRGIFRNPEWDRWNEKAARKAAVEQAAAGLPQLQKAFTAYARGFLSGNEEHDRHQQLKIHHSLLVLEHARTLVEQEPAFAEPEPARALLLAALFHDVGRFPQFHRWKTYADPLSCNHAALGMRVLHEQGFLSREPDRVRRLAFTAIASHNRAKVPSAFSGDALAVLNGLRDADKLDILRIMAENLGPNGDKDGTVLLHLEDRPGAYTPVILTALEERRQALYSDMRFVNDFRILLCTWLFDFRFAASRAAAMRNGHLACIIDGMEGLPDIQKTARTIMEDIFAAPENAPRHE